MKKQFTYFVLTMLYMLLSLGTTMYANNLEYNEIMPNSAGVFDATTPQGLGMRFHITDAEAKTAEVYGVNETRPAINKETAGSVEDLWKKTTTSYDFEDGNAVFTATSRMSVEIQENAAKGSKVLALINAKNTQNGYGFAYFDFSENVVQASKVTVKFDYFNGAGRGCITIGDALVRGKDGKGAGMDRINRAPTYGAKGAIFRIGASGDGKSYIVNDVVLGTAEDWCNKWLTVEVGIYNFDRQVEWVIKDGEEILAQSGTTVGYGEEATPGKVGFWQADANEATQIDVFGSVNNNISYIDNVSITAAKDPTIIFYDYKIRYVDANGKDLKEARIANGRAGTDPIILASDSDHFYLNKAGAVVGTPAEAATKKIYVSNNAESVKVAENAEVLITFRDAETHYAVLNCNTDGGVLLAQFRDFDKYKFFEGDSYVMFIPRAYAKDGAYYFTPATDWNGASFTFPGTLNPTVAGGRTIYIGSLNNYAKVDSVVYYANFEDLALPKVDAGQGTGLGQLEGTVTNWWNWTNGYWSRFDGGRGITLGANSYVWTEPIAEAGNYKVTIYGRNNIYYQAESYAVPQPYKLGLRNAAGEVTYLDIEIPQWGGGTTGESVVENVAIPAGFSLVIICDGSTVTANDGTELAKDITLDDISLAKQSSETPYLFTQTVKVTGNGTVGYNGISIRNSSKAFSMSYGASATFTITPDANSSITSVRLNGTDITSDVINNQYTISNIKRNNILVVEFEVISPITYTLGITATGNGSATYNNTEVRGKTQSFTVDEGTSATISFTPDTGYRIAGVKLNGMDVTSNVADNKYTISSISANTTLAVTFEAITHTLSISSSGSGSANFNNTTVRSKTAVFTVNDGTSATITFTPDTGYRIASVKLNGTDVTTSVADNKYTISNITANKTLAVTFEVIPPTTYTLSITATGNGRASYDGTEVKGKTTSFTVTEGTSATVTFKPDNGYKIASLKVNDSDVTSSIINNQYTITNISSNTTIEVTFVAITHTLSITASGNGSATYDGTEVKGKTTSFTVTEGMSATITFTPDAGYRIVSVKLNETDVSSSIVNNQYTITNISSNTTIEVTFEAITHTLSITALGNGIAIYGGTEVRGKTASFTVTEGTSATITFTPDAGYCIASVKVNDTDVTSSVADNKYTISNITANTTLEVEFVEVITDMAYDGVNYKVVSYDDKTVNVASGNYGLTLTVPATFEAKDKTWTVTGIDSDALTNATELAAVIWEPEVLFNNEVSNPNLLLYVKDAKFAPSYIQNVVVGDQAENIVLKDAANGNNFYCPKAFTAKRISYEHHYNMTTGYNTCQGWETIALPFDVTTVLNQKGVDLVPYASWQQGSSQRPFWLYQMTSNGWQAATAIQSNTPYIISMPNNVVYQPSYIQTGYIQFLGSNVEVKTSSQLNESQYGKRHFYVSYQQQSDISDIYALNVNNQWSSNTDVSQAEGSAFIRNSRTIHPFEAYMTIEGGNAPWMIPVFDNNMPTNIVEIERMRNVGNEDWYDLQGRKLQGEPKQDGIYIRNGKKIKK